MIGATIQDGCPQTRATAAPTSAAPWPRDLCPECLARVVGRRRGSLFCCDDHKRAHNRRMAKRGAVLAALYAAARTTRDGTRGSTEQRTIGKRASADCALAHQIWKEEDERDRRMPALEYIALRYRHGFVEVVR